MREHICGKTMEGVSVNEEFEELRPVLTSWVKMVNQYSAAHENEDACYWYNERATLSVLAAATWKIDGWVALEEFSTGKICKVNRVQKNGRCDLYISSDNNSYACEAKQAWDKVGDLNSRETISGMLDSAWKDTSELTIDEADKRLAICFCVPSFEKPPTDVEIRSWLEMCQKFNHVAFAYSFPHGVRNLQSNREHERFFPGVAAIIQHRRRGIREHND